MLPDGEIIKEMEEEEIYKYLGVVESIAIKHTDMKEKTTNIFKKTFEKYPKHRSYMQRIS